MKIRFASVEDIPVILELSAMMVEESRFHPYGLNCAKLTKAIEAAIQHSGHSLVLLAERQPGDTVGMLAGHMVELFFCDAIIAQDRVFFVRPDARGSSAALKLLLAFRRWAEQRKVQELSINMSVAVDMDRFNKMMTKLGFRCCGSNFSLGLAPARAAI